MYRLLVWVLTFVIMTCISDANAQRRTQGAVPTKTIDIYNNSTTETIYPVIVAGAKFDPDPGPELLVHDLWMQAQFDISVADVNTRAFQTRKIYRIWVNKQNGIPPLGSVTITLPFYTQLLPSTAADLGKVDDQFVGWWNAMRVFIFDGKDAVNAAFNFSLDNSNPQKPVPPPPITPIAGAALPTCTSGNTACEPLIINSYYVGFPTSVPVQLVEYTFASAEGPPLAKQFKMMLEWVNYNISGVDWLYLPVAIGAHGNAGADNQYLGSTQQVQAFRTDLADLAKQGDSWPQYVPAYYDPEKPTIPLQSPPSGQTAYPEPQVPSANIVLAESFRNPPPAPPVLTSDTLSGIGVLGDAAQSMVDLWMSCTGTNTVTSPTCTRIRQLNAFFSEDYRRCFGKAPPLSDVDFFHSYLRDVYGWVQFQGCSGSLADVMPKDYPKVIKTFCELQYNFFDNTIPRHDVFNPYVELVHVTLQSNAYAFSIDDEQAFKHVLGDGVVIAVAGKNGLQSKQQAPLPKASNFQTFCQGGH